jgi:hypothetical protein
MNAKYLVLLSLKLPKNIMKSEAMTVTDYLQNLPADREPYVNQLRKTIQQNIPAGFEEVMGYGMITYVVPKSTYPAGYHCDPKLPLPFLSIASQKNFVALYHMGIYGSPELLNWFVGEYPKHCKSKLDMGKSCIRFKKPDQIPFELIGELMKKITVNDWINFYESTWKNNKK